MKKTISLLCCLMLVMSLSGCGEKTEAPVVQPPQQKYPQIVERLDAGDYDGARALIDAMEGISATEPVSETQPAPTETQAPPAQIQPQTLSPEEGSVIQLTKENAKDYFEATVNFFNGDEKSFHQAIALKPEYQSRVIRLEEVTLEVSYLLCNAHGSVDDRNGEFTAEGFEVTSDEKQTMKVTIDNSNTGYLSNGTYVKNKGYFPNFAIETEILSGTGRLILMDE